MTTVFIPPQLRELTGGTTQVQLTAKNIREVIAGLEDRFPGIKPRLCEGEELSGRLQVSIDGSLTSRGMLTKVSPTSEVHFLPAIGGG